MPVAVSQPADIPELGWSFGNPIALGVMTIVAICLLVFYWRNGQRFSQ